MQSNTLKQCNVQQILEEKPVLCDLPVGSHLGLGLDSDRGLHLYLNGNDQGVIGTDVPDPCYFMFDVIAHCTKVLCRSCYMHYVLR